MLAFLQAVNADDSNPMDLLATVSNYGAQVSDSDAVNDILTGLSNYGNTSTTTSDSSEPPAEPSRGTFSTKQKALHRLIQSRVVDMYDMGVADAGSYINYYADRFYDARGRWPTSSEMWTMQEFHDGAAGFTSAIGINLPGAFQTQDGQIWVNSGFSILPLGSGILGQDDELRGIEDELAFLNRAQPGLVTPNIVDQYRNLPMLSSETIMALLSPPTFSGGRDRVSSGASYRAPVFDRNEVREYITNEWRTLLLEEPDNVDELVDGYISEAKQFHRDGGSLNLQVWTLDRARTTPRHSLLYRKKPEDLSENQYLGGYVGAASQFGLNQRNRIQEIEAGASSGAGLAGFTERVSRSRPVSTANQGRLSQSLAQTIGGLGALARS